jgi:hypothetical protein
MLFPGVLCQFFFGNGDGRDFDMAIFFEVVVAGELVEGFATKAERGGRGKFHVTQSLVDALAGGNAKQDQASVFGKLFLSSPKPSITKI